MDDQGPSREYLVLGASKHELKKISRDVGFLGGSGWKLRKNGSDKAFFQSNRDKIRQKMEPTELLTALQKLWRAESTVGGRWHS